MSETKSYIQRLFTGNNLVVTGNRVTLFEEFVNQENSINAVKIILENQKFLMTNWNLKTRIADIIQQHIVIPNGTVGKAYEAKLDFQKLNWNDIIFYELENLDLLGLEYDSDSETIKGIPSQSGDIKIKFKFRVSGESEDSTLNEKQISLVVNPDPKSLWKNIESDKNDPYWKEDNVTAFEKLGNKHIVVSSKRGRSHANVGSFRDDDFAFTHLENTGWSIVVVADGAGGSKTSRKGSSIACQSIINYFSENITEDNFAEFDTLIAQQQNGSEEESLKKLNLFVYNQLGKAALHAHKKLEEFATTLEAPLKDLHTTLIFALVKKYEFGYAILSFGVGDCPIGLLNKDLTKIDLMNWLDVGEFGGGTRFITMPEIFKSEKFSTRFGFRLVQDFSYLILMTDGIYDPKFVVEANLEKIEKWQEFLDDLNGSNPDNTKVEFNSENKEIEQQLSSWMDFWNAGNHDDRTLAIVF
jgi:serine/threonine protein phosphatase PrpC